MIKRHCLILTVLAILLCANSSFAISPSEKSSLAKEAHLLEIPLTEKNGKMQLNLELTMEQRCMFGDADLIGIEVSRNKEAKIIAAIEPLTGGDAKGQKGVVVDFSDVSNTGKFLVEVPVVSAPTVFGLYICGDTKKDNSCKIKNLLTFDQIIAPYTKPGGAALNEGLEDKIYFFGHIILDKNSASISTDGLTASGYEALEKYLSLLSVPSAKERTDQIKRIHTALGSMPLAGGRGKITMNLPRMDHQKCGGKPAARPAGGAAETPTQKEKEPAKK